MRMEVSYTLLDFDELKERRAADIVRTGIYFLWSEDEIVYIGQSVNMHYRVGTHLTSPAHTLRDVKFTACTFIDCRPEDLNVLEALYIDRYKPRLNGGRKKSRRSI